MNLDVKIYLNYHIQKLINNLTHHDVEHAMQKKEKSDHII